MIAVGYNHIGWSPNASSTTATFTTSYTVPNSAQTLYAVWQAGSGTKYISKHWQQNAENGEYTLYETEEHSGLTESDTTVIAHTYAGFTAKAFSQKPILGDGSTVVDVYYDRNIYDWGTIKNRVRDDVSKLMYERTKRSPMILPILMEI